MSIHQVGHEGQASAGFKETNFIFILYFICSIKDKNQQYVRPLNNIFWPPYPAA